jgi:hypothetical protein
MLRDVPGAKRGDRGGRTEGPRQEQQSRTAAQHRVTLRRGL